MKSASIPAKSNNTKEGRIVGVDCGCGRDNCPRCAALNGSSAYLNHAYEIQKAVELEASTTTEEKPKKDRKKK